MSVLAVIPARYGSIRFEGKVLVDIMGKPMVQHVYERTGKANIPDEVIVATDDQRVYGAVKDFNGNVIMTGEHITGTDRIAEVASRIDHEIIVNVQGDEPLIEPAMIDEAIQPLLDHQDVDLSTLAHRIDSKEDYLNPNVVKVLIDQAGFAMYFSRSPVPHIKLGKWKPDIPAYRHVGLYVFRREALLEFAQLPSAPFESLEGLEQLRFLENGYRMKVLQTKYRSIGVDTPEDLEKVIEIIKSSD
ncbi:3-deoxy-manno-octulosonate cytidylyltransferase [Candidatus Poribacteria bacterium]|nr:3-deoxy-manno-octulosonate cytidylyltransferase [Candidatus Poribacteria bacterium]